ncbi:MAG: helix-turn-helix transcriptional regulator [Clostridia bacterium]|nr:helix-turn-helix transcriptional regulator [Clostridia bacterium]
MYYYQRLRDLREDHDRTQSEIAEFLGMKYQQYARYEIGEREIPLHHLISLAKYYNVSLDYLAGLTDTVRTLDGSRYRINKNITITQTGNGKINIKN